MKKELITTNISALEYFESAAADGNMIFDEISQAFCRGEKNVIVSGKASGGKTCIALDYAKSDECTCEKVIYASFDREKYLCHDVSIDALLKKSLVNHMLCNDKTCECLNYLEAFEKSLDENTLLIIDDYNINAPSPYMRHLFALDCRVLVITRCNMENAPCTVVRVNLVDENDKPCDFSLLDEESKELLMTVCAMLCYLDGTNIIVSSSKSVFDEEALRFYVGDFADKLHVLVGCGFVKLSLSGRICVDNKTIETVMTQLRPSSQNCKTFMAFISKTLDFDIMQCSKDFKGRLSVCDREEIPLFAFEEILVAYTHFVKSDDRCGKRLYNLLFGLMLDRLALSGGKYCNSHLLVNNASYYLNTLCSCLEDENLLSELYSDRFYVYDSLPDFYSYNIRAKLDVVRLACMYLRNLTADLYDFASFSFKLLYDSMEYLFDKEISACDDTVKKLMLLDDVIRLCDEVFSYTQPVDEDGEYLPFRDDMKFHRISFTGEKNCDDLYAVSCAFGHSLMTVKLYGMYQKYIDTWLDLFKENTETAAGKLLASFYKEKHEERLNKSKEITMQFNRIILGYENCVPACLPEGRNSIKPYEYTFGDEFKKRLEDNKRFLLRGFDGGSKSGGKRYAKMILSAFGQCSDKLKMLSIILDYDYPLSDNTYESLDSAGFAELVICCDMANLSKQMLLEMLVFRYRADSKKKKLTLLIETIVEGLLLSVTQNTASASRLCDFTASSYLRNKMNNFSCGDFITSLYERVCNNSEANESICHELLASALYRKISGVKVEISNNKLCKAFEVYVAGQKMCRNNIDEETMRGFSKYLLC